VLAEDIRAAGPIPAHNRAARDGFAVQASASSGAGAYNPVHLPLIPVAIGDALPARADAVVPRDLGQPDERGSVEVVETAAPGDNVERQGALAAAGALLVPAGVKPAARHIGLLAIAGRYRVAVVRRPLVRILLVRPARPDADDSNGPMIRAAIERDGGVVDEPIAVERSQAAIRDALVNVDSDMVLVVGGTGPGINDHSAAALAEAGELAIHGVALRPGETTGLGCTDDRVPVVLLPGTPAACLWSYELFAGRAIRRLGGRDPGLPYRSREMTVGRKIVSAIGMTEICPVRCGAGDTVTPLPSFAETGLMAAVESDGFVIIPEASEGSPQGAPVTVYLYEDR